MEENTYKIRKDRVKNIAIVFLSVMLVLTFFSNSILNHSLPEVATEYVAYDTITERVRGTGTVTADDPYKVIAKDSRTIESVAVAAGDMVTKDQVLFYLEGEESEELKTKEAELDDLILNYTTSILSGDISNEAYQHIQGGNIASVAAYQAQIEAARVTVQNAQDTVDSIERQILVASSSDGADNDAELAEAEADMKEAENRMTAAQNAIDSANAKITALDAKAKEAGEALEITALNASTAFEAAKAAYMSAKDSLVTVLSTVLTGEDAFKENEYFNKKGMPKDVDALEKLYTLSAENGAEAEFTVLKDAYNTYLTTNTARKEAEQDVADYKAAKSALSTAKTELTNATNEYNAYASKVNSLSVENVEAAGDKEEWIASLNVNLADAQDALAKAKEDQTQLLTDISKELDLSNQNGIIAEKQKELEELREKSNGSTIVSPVEGTIISVSKTAGESTAAQEEVALIQVAGKGMTVSFSVTNEQAAKVKIGDVAELQNAWYYEDVMVTLSKIKPDTEEPGKKKLLEFNVEGSVQSGEQLALTVGEQSAEYDLVVPNSAVREDKNGKFVFIIEEKSTPFGNRYKAKRVDVEVMASDETKSALTADLEGYEYVITTSNQPVENGDQVRLADY